MFLKKRRRLTFNPCVVLCVIGSRQNLKSLIAKFKQVSPEGSISQSVRIKESNAVKDARS